MRFLQHVLTGNRTKASLSAMVMNRLFLAPRRVGWTHDLMAMFPSIQDDIRTTNLTNAQAVRRLYAKLARSLADRKRARTLSSSHHHLLSLFPSLSTPRSFGEILGQLSFESVRVIILFLGNMTRFSYLRPRLKRCPFCPKKMYSQHFFDCEQYAALGDEPVSWSDFVQMFVRREWLDGISSVVRRLLGWSRRADIFRFGFRHEIDLIFEELEWLRGDRIRRAGGVIPPDIGWSRAS
jgi:hypothetical protein